MKLLRDTSLIFQRQATLLLRNPVWIFVGVFQPVTYLLLFAPLLKPALQVDSNAAAYQIFDGLYCGSSFCLRGAGDTRVPAATALVLSWFFFVPLAHTLIFAPGAGWIDGLPQFGLGAKGGWLALMSYCTLLGTAMFWRWRHGAWRRFRL